MGCIVPLEWSDGFVELCGDWVCGDDRQIKGMKDTLFMRMRGESADKVSGRWLVDRDQILVWRKALLLKSWPRN